MKKPRCKAACLSLDNFFPLKPRQQQEEQQRQEGRERRRRLQSCHELHQERQALPQPHGQLCRPQDHYLLKEVQRGNAAQWERSQLLGQQDLHARQQSAQEKSADEQQPLPPVERNQQRVFRQPECQYEETQQERVVPSVQQQRQQQQRQQGDQGQQQQTCMQRPPETTLQFVKQQQQHRRRWSTAFVHLLSTGTVKQAPASPLVPPTALRDTSPAATRPAGRGQALQQKQEAQSPQRQQLQHQQLRQQLQRHAQTQDEQLLQPQHSHLQQPYISQERTSASASARTSHLKPIRDGEELGGRTTTTAPAHLPSAPKEEGLFSSTLAQARKHSGPIHGTSRTYACHSPPSAARSNKRLRRTADQTADAADPACASAVAHAVRGTVQFHKKEALAPQERIQHVVPSSKNLDDGKAAAGAHCNGCAADNEIEAPATCRESLTTAAAPPASSAPAQARQAKERPTYAAARGYGEAAEDGGAGRRGAAGGSEKKGGRPERTLTARDAVATVACAAVSQEAVAQTAVAHTRRTASSDRAAAGGAVSKPLPPTPEDSAAGPAAEGESVHRRRAAAKKEMPTAPAGAASSGAAGQTAGRAARVAAAGGGDEEAVRGDAAERQQRSSYRRQGTRRLRAAQWTELPDELLQQVLAHCARDALAVCRRFAATVRKRRRQLCVSGTLHATAAEKPAHIVAAIQKSCNLRLLSITGVSSLTSRLLEPLWKAGSSCFPVNLECLVLRKCPKLSPRSIRFFTSRLRHLRAVDLQDNCGLDKEAVAALRFLPKLERVALGLTSTARGRSSAHTDASLVALLGLPPRAAALPSPPPSLCQPCGTAAAAAAAGARLLPTTQQSHPPTSSLLVDAVGPCPPPPAAVAAAPASFHFSSLPPSGTVSQAQTSGDWAAAFSAAVCASHIHAPPATSPAGSTVAGATASTAATPFSAAVATGQVASAGHSFLVTASRAAPPLSTGDASEFALFLSSSAAVLPPKAAAGAPPAPYTAAVSQSPSNPTNVFTSVSSSSASAKASCSSSGAAASSSATAASPSVPRAVAAAASACDVAGRSRQATAVCSTATEDFAAAFSWRDRCDQREAQEAQPQDEREILRRTTVNDSRSPAPLARAELIQPTNKIDCVTNRRSFSEHRFASAAAVAEAAGPAAPAMPQSESAAASSSGLRAPSTSAVAGLPVSRATAATGQREAAAGAARDAGAPADSRVPASATPANSGPSATAAAGRETVRGSGAPQAAVAAARAASVVCSVQVISSREGPTEKYSRTPPLKLLSLARCSDIASLTPLLNACETLEFLDLRGCVGLNDDSAAAVLAYLKQLQVLIIAGTSMGSATVEALAANCRSLEVLDLTGLSAVTRSAALLVPLQLKKLKRLKLSKLPLVDDDCVRTCLTELPGLVLLDVSHCWRVSTACCPSAPLSHVAAGDAFRRFGLLGCNVERQRLEWALRDAGASRVQLSLHHELQICEMSSIYANMKDLSLKPLDPF